MFVSLPDILLLDPLILLRASYFPGSSPLVRSVFAILGYGLSLEKFMICFLLGPLKRLRFRRLVRVIKMVSLRFVVLALNDYCRALFMKTFFPFPVPLGLGFCFIVSFLPCGGLFNFLVGFPSLRPRMVVLYLCGCNGDIVRLLLWTNRFYREAKLHSVSLVHTGPLVVI
jgi:hypothetical protein